MEYGTTNNSHIYVLSLARNRERLKGYVICDKTYLKDLRNKVKKKQQLSIWLNITQQTTGMLPQFGPAQQWNSKAKVLDVQRVQRQLGVQRIAKSSQDQVALVPRPWLGHPQTERTSIFYMICIYISMYIYIYTCVYILYKYIFYYI